MAPTATEAPTPNATATEAPTPAPVTVPGPIPTPPTRRRLMEKVHGPVSRAFHNWQQRHFASAK
jgi:hypothetical protein